MYVSLDFTFCAYFCNLCCSYADVGFGKVGVYLHGKPLTPENNYFEVEILDVGTRGDIGTFVFLY